MTLYIDYIDGQYESFFYSEGNRYKGKSSRDITVVLTWAKKEGFDKIVEIFKSNPDYDLSIEDTEDILHDYKMMLEDFGKDDPLVKEYREELIKRGVTLKENPERPPKEWVKELSKILREEGFTKKEVEKLVIDKWENEKPSYRKWAIKEYKNNPERPPKKWFDRTVKALSDDPEIDDPQAVAGWIWHHQMTPAKKKEVLRMEKKNPAKRKKVKHILHDAFPTKEGAKQAVDDLRSYGDMAYFKDAGEEAGRLRYMERGNPGAKWHEDEEKYYERLMLSAKDKIGTTYFEGKKDAHKHSKEVSKAHKMNPIAIWNEPDKRTLIYDLCLEIRAKKNFHDNYKGEKFKHTFSPKTHAQIFGLKDGSILIKSKKGTPLWKHE